MNILNDVIPSKTILVTSYQPRSYSKESQQGHSCLRRTHAEEKSTGKEILKRKNGLFSIQGHLHKV